MAQHREKPFKGSGDGRRAMIVKNFRCEARRPWCRLVWKSAIEACGGTQDAAAQRLFVTTSAVSEGLQHGRLSIDCLVLAPRCNDKCEWVQHPVKQPRRRSARAPLHLNHRSRQR
jgi:hypothetical protein